MHGSRVEYTAHYGRHRNLMGNWSYEDMSYEFSPEPRSRKKQYPAKKCQI